MHSPVDPFRESAAETPEEETARLSRNGVWQEVMRTDQGRMVLGRILRDLGLFVPVVGERMAGRHEAAILLLREMEDVSPKLAHAIMLEAMNDEAAP